MGYFQKKGFSLLIATTNLHKIREYKAMFKEAFPIDILTLHDFPNYKPAEESGTTFEENAITKSVDAAKELSLCTLADDSGLVVPALDGAPGIYSARYAGTGASDRDNRKKLLAAMSSLSGEDRYAYYHCAIALALPERLEKQVQGTCEGQIITEEKGGAGFGYDPLFIKHEYSKTFSELKESIKNRISHRRKAFDKILPILTTICDSCTI